ncbi:MAG: PAS domain S-box protein [Pirellulales bacterium]|nr:PAS domain S-box protein [Pirellulales bacterium]
MDERILANRKLKEQIAELEATVQALRQREMELKLAHQMALAQVQQNEERCRKTLDHMLEGCQIINRQWRYVYVNDAVAKHGQRRKEELIGHTLMEIYPGIEHSDLFVFLNQCMNERISYRIENEFHYNEGEARWFELSIQPVPEGVFVLSLDITNRKKMEQSLARREEEYRVLFEESRDAFMTITPPTWKFSTSNRACMELFGARDMTEFKSFTPWGLSPELQPDGQSSLEKAREMIEIAKQKGSVFFEWTHHRINGEIFQATVFLTRIELGDEIVLLATVRDITESIRARESLRESESLLAQVERIAKIGGWEMDMVRQTVKWTQGAYAIIGLEPGQPLPRPDQHLEYCLPEYQDLVTESMQVLIEEDRPLELEVQYRTVQGDLRWCSLHAKAVRERGICTKIRGTMQDITEQKRIEEEARQAQEKLILQQRNEKDRVQAELIRVQDELVRKTRLAAIGQIAASIAHDLRNPLGAAGNACYFLKHYGSGDKEQTEEYLQIIDRELRTAHEVIDGLLSMAREKEPAKESVDLREIIEDVVQTVITEDQVACHISLEPEPFIVEVDSIQIRQMVTNLIRNAVQAMRGRGELVIEASREPDQHIIRFRDTGPGFDPKILEVLFEPLVTTKAKGTGLGLTICRQIVQRHGGTIEGTNHADGGAVITIHLPRS